ncbi:MAG: TonBC domain-containing protein [Nitrospira sp.]|nr:MAG: TonBC domain-containing protein [Nitrospira sp.]
MTDSRAGMPDAFVRLRASGWIISLSLHGTAVFLAALLAARLGLAPPSSSFHWDVTVVTPSVAPSTPSPTTDTPQTGPKPARMTARSTSISPPRSAPSDLPHPMESALASNTMRHEPYTPPSALPSPSEDIESRPQHVQVLPLPESAENPRTQPATEHSLTSVPQFPTESEQEHPSLSSPIKDIEPTTQLSSSLPASQHPPNPTPAPALTAALAPSMSNLPAPPRKADYGWLAGILSPRIETLKQYPVDARLKHIEGRVVVRIVIQENGQIVSAAIAKSSGHDILDQAALETIRKVSSITLTQPLEQSTVTLHVPIRYQLGP